MPEFMLGKNRLSAGISGFFRMVRKSHQLRKREQTPEETGAVEQFVLYVYALAALQKWTDCRAQPGRHRASPEMKPRGQSNRRRDRRRRADKSHHVDCRVAFENAFR